MEETIALQQGRLYNTARGSVGVTHIAGPAPDGQPARVYLGVNTPDGVEHDYVLQAGDQFPFGEAIWSVQAIEPTGVRPSPSIAGGPGEYVVRISRVDDAAQPDELR